MTDKDALRKFTVDSLDDITTHWGDGSVRHRRFRAMFPVPRFQEAVEITDGKTTIRGTASVRITGNEDAVEVWLVPDES